MRTSVDIAQDHQSIKSCRPLMDRHCHMTHCGKAWTYDANYRTTQAGTVSMSGKRAVSHVLQENMTHESLRWQWLAIQGHCCDIAIS